MYKRRSSHPRQGPGCIGFIFFAILFALAIVPLYFIGFSLDGAEENTRAQRSGKGACVRGADCYQAGMRDYQAGNYAAAARLLETACLRKFARSCEVRGAMALEGKTGAVSLKEALEYFEAGCDMEYAHACHLMADTIRRNYKDDPGAMADVHRIWPRACYLGSVEGCLAYAELLAGTEGQTQDLYKALIFLDKACGLAPQGPACQKARDLRENLLLRKADDNSAGSRSARRKRKAVPPRAGNAGGSPGGLQSGQ